MYKLHDSVALGNFEQGLLRNRRRRCPTSRDDHNDDNNHNDNEEEEWQKAEVERLPLLLRILSQSRPLATSTTSVWTSLQKQKQQEQQENQDTQDELKNPDTKDDDQHSSDTYDSELERAVQRLEDRAAVYSVSESVEVVACHLSPFVCRKIAKLPPLHRTKTDHSWNTAPLMAVALNPSSSRFQQAPSQHQHNQRASGAASTQTKRAKTTPQQHHTSDAGATTGDEDLSLGDRDDEHEDQEEDDSDVELSQQPQDSRHCLAPPPRVPKRKSLSSLGSTITTTTTTGTGERESILLARGEAEDSQEAFCTKTLSELALVVAGYLQHETDHHHQQQRQQWSSIPTDTTTAPTEPTKQSTTNATTATIQPAEQQQQQQQPRQRVSMEESILAQVRVVSETSGSGAGSTDLGATCASLLYHAPVLRYTHLAAALCRAGQPQTPVLLKRLAVNCPSALACLVRGCLLVLLHSHGNTHDDTTNNNSNNDQERPMLDAATAAPVLPTSDNPIPTTTTTTTTIPSATVMALSHSFLSSSGWSTQQYQLARASLSELASLSPRERHRIRTTLRGTNMLLNVQLELALEDPADPITVACLLVQHLSSSSSFLDPSSNQDPFHPSMVQSIVNRVETWIPRILHVLTLGLLPRTSGCGNIGPAQRRLLLQALLWVCVTQDFSTLRRVPFLDPASTNRVLQETNRLLSLLHPHQTTDDSQQDWDNDIYCLWLPSILYMTYILDQSRIEVSSTDDKERHSLEPMMNRLKELWKAAGTLKTKAFVGSLASTLLSSSPSAEPHLFRSFLLSYLKANNDVISLYKARWTEDEVALREWCANRDLNLLPLVVASLDDTTLREDASSVPVVMQACPSVLSKETVERILTTLILTPSKSLAMQLLTDRQTLPLMVNMVSYWNNLEGPTVPIVSSLRIELQATAFLQTWRNKTMDTECAIFLLQLVYCFVFLDKSPGNAFGFNPRLMPLRQVWLLLHSPKDGTSSIIARALERFLLECLDQYAPDVIELSRYHQRLESCPRFLFTRTKQDTMMGQEELQHRLHSSLSSSPKDFDRSGSRAERLFLQAFLTLSDRTLVCTTASALLSKPHAPPVFVTYSKLVEDPLTLFKCPVKEVWMRPGVRRIILFLLTMLVNANSSVLHHRRKDQFQWEISSRELLATRDLLTVRCLVSSACSVPGASNMRSFATESLVRWIVCSRRGLVAALFKQGLPFEELDWLIHHVPEISLDWTSFMELLSEQVSLSPAERIAIADGVVKSIVLYGQRETATSQALMLGSLSQLVAGFFLVLGPSGVSVSTLLSTGDSSSSSTTTTMDSPHGSKKSALRILKHVTAVRAYRTTLRNECIIALQKLYRLCKGEELVGGLAVAIGARQKGTLREIQDALTKALTALGSGS